MQLLANRMETIRGAYLGWRVTYFCPLCGTHILLNVAEGTGIGGRLTSNKHLRGFIDRCTETKEPYFVFWEVE